MESERVGLAFALADYTDARSAGLEEYIEGLSFLHYLDKGDLITIEEIQATLSDSETGEPVSRIGGNGGTRKGRAKISLSS